MVRKESAPIPQKETFLDKTKKFVLKILGIGALIGIGYVALKNVIVPYLGGKIDKLKKILS